jgi:hypothetical protein
MSLRWILAGAAAAAFAVTLVSAHHSLAGVYDTERKISKEGAITRFQFVNPHPLLTMSVKEENKAERPWTLELDNLSELVEIGITRETFKPGDRVIVSGNPGRDNQERIYVLQLDRPADGLRYEQIGTTPRIEKRPSEKK